MEQRRTNSPGMMHRWRLMVFPALLCLGLLFTCTDEGVRPSDSDMVGFVVQGYLYRGLPVSDIRILSLIAVGSEDTVLEVFSIDEDSGDTLPVVEINRMTGDTTYRYYDTVAVVDPINDAEVTITVDGDEYELTATGDSGYYEETNQTLIIKENKTYHLKIKYNGITATAEAMMPSRPDNVSISGDTLYQSMGGMGGMGGGGMGGGGMGGMPGDTNTTEENDDEPTSLTISWDNDKGSPYYVVSQVVEVDTINTPTGAPVDSTGENPFGDGENPFGDSENPFAGDSMIIEMITRPRGTFSYSNSLAISGQTGGGMGMGTQWGQVSQLSVTVPGRYVVRVYRVSEKYETVHESIMTTMMEQTFSGSLQEPLTNIKNALGVFAAFNYDSVMFDVVQSKDSTQTQQ